MARRKRNLPGLAIGGAAAAWTAQARLRGRSILQTPPREGALAIDVVCCNGNAGAQSPPANENGNISPATPTDNNMSQTGFLRGTHARLREGREAAATTSQTQEGGRDSPTTRSTGDAPAGKGKVQDGRVLEARRGKTTAAPSAATPHEGDDADFLATQNQIQGDTRRDAEADDHEEDQHTDRPPEDEEGEQIRQPNRSPKREGRREEEVATENAVQESEHPVHEAKDASAPNLPVDATTTTRPGGTERKKEDASAAP
ncbi:unnamed protein product, partial [Amoebophrya sp. A25]|eukprot:GSA25T00006614001.1